MNLSSKLRLIQEGYTIEDINSGDVKPYSQINETSYFDEFSLITESIFSDINYATQISMDMLQESDGPDKKSIFKRFIDWIIEKIRQFKIFIMNLFKRKKEELANTHISQLKRLLNKEFKPFMVSNTLEKIINSPDDAIKSLKELVENFEDTLVNKIDAAYTGFNGEITENIDLNGLQIIAWKQVTNNANISYDHNVTGNVIDHVLGKTNVVRIHSKDQIINILNFADNFYDLWKDMNNSLTYYESQLKELREFAHDGFKVITLICETMLHTFPEILKWVDGYIRKLTMIEKYME